MFQTKRPKATLFGSELFLAEWEAGVQYVQRTICMEDMAGKSCNSPDCIIISEPWRGRVCLPLSHVEGGGGEGTFSYGKAITVCGHNRPGVKR
jgi:hypothetical protein